jgi:predicted ribosome quality control (RQC) complex YloA/Tae2 family protein
MDKDGAALKIPVDPEKTFVENAQALFARAKKAKAGRPAAVRKASEVGAEVEALRTFLALVESAYDPAEIERLENEAVKNRWLPRPQTPKRRPRDLPFEGKKIKTLEGPSGARILLGENAEANDYLTLRVARPNDIWLHVRGGVSAHVVIATDGKPERVPGEVIEFAARLAVRNSPSKHSGLVPVDWTLRKHVRKPRGAPAGTALYTHEKTLHVEKEP